MKAFVIGVLFVLLLATAGYSLDFAAGTFASGNVQNAVANADTEFQFGLSYGIEFGFLHVDLGLLGTDAQVWPRFQVELDYYGTYDRASLLFGTDFVIIDKIGFQPGLVLQLNMDDSIQTPFGGMMFPRTVTGIGPSIQISHRFDILGGMLVVRPAFTLKYVFMSDDSMETLLNFGLYMHLRGFSKT